MPIIFPLMFTLPVWKYITQYIIYNTHICVYLFYFDTAVDLFRNDQFKGIGFILKLLRFEALQGFLIARNYPSDVNC